MKRLLMILSAAALIVSVSATTASADVAKGQKLFSKKLKKDCDMTGAKMAGKHTQAQWEELMEAGKIGQEIMTICPNVKEEDVKDSWIQHIYDFSYEYANDSGNVPSC